MLNKNKARFCESQSFIINDTPVTRRGLTPRPVCSLIIPTGVAGLIRPIKSSRPCLFARPGLHWLLLQAWHKPEGPWFVWTSFYGRRDERSRLCTAPYQPVIN
ncbi:hypothetical protein PoB_007558900 [Plakobranchus ocellatus]|uniref:Uncharacterized protein n=1 Tax=Plakobranchus ocellatus TaxID=259542 RepID=A0AAV4DYE1_9GAST|nr:hypothetical protein PoB_007558900 [Plakobranchus ocellatus]